MPGAGTYPGVYIEEVPSGVRTITGVATSITAFVGRAPRGPVNDPTAINSFGDFERAFGGLNAGYPLGYAVRDFYMNGGAQGIIVRLQSGGSAATLSLLTGVPTPNDTLPLVAANVGSWGGNLTATVNYATKDTTDTNLFNLKVTESGGASETFLNVSIDPASPRFLPRVLENDSALVRVKRDGDKWVVPNVRPKAAETAADKDTGKDSAPFKDADYTGSQADKTGLFALEKADLFNLLCVPPDVRAGETSAAVYQAAMTYCAARRAMLIVDPPLSWTTAAKITDNSNQALTDLGLSGESARNAAVYFPRLLAADPNRDGQVDVFPPCGAVAGVMARTDSTRGVWKAPAGLDGAVNGVLGLAANLTDAENGMLNPLGINCLRSFPVAGRVVWGARTLRGADQLADEYKYVPVRRLALYIEESLYRGTQWVVFEPNDEPLWAQIRLNVGAFMQNLFRQGAFQGKTPREAYLVKCDKETTTQNDVNLGVVNILVGFAPLKPAEFVVIRIQQLAGQITA